MRALAAVLALLATGMARRPPEKTMENLPEWRGAQAARAEPDARLITDRASWEALWKEAVGLPPPELDFSRHSAVAVFAGLKNTGGWAPEVLPAEDADGCVVIPYRVRGPAPGAFVIQAFTKPYLVRVVPKRDCKVRLERRP